MDGKRPYQRNRVGAHFITSLMSSLSVRAIGVCVQNLLLVIK